MTQRKFNTPPEWNLTSLYKNQQDPQIDKDIDNIQTQTQNFIKKYKKEVKSKNLSPKTFLEALQKYEKIVDKLSQHRAYFELLHNKKNNSAEIGKLYQKSKEFSNKIFTQLVWFEIAWIKLDKKRANKILKYPGIKKYQHHLEQERIFQPYTLSEKEEKILIKKNQSGASAFIRLYDEIDSNNTFRLKINGKTQTLTESELKPYLISHPNRQIRKKAAQSRTKVFKKKKNIYTAILNNLLLDKKINDEIRKYKFPQQATFLGYEIKPETVKTMIHTVQNNQVISEKFYKIKKKILGYDQLHEWDRYSTIFKTDKKYTWKQAKEIIINSLKEFHPKFADTAKLFFNNQWIDAKLIKGKSSGAFHYACSPNASPYIFLNYTGQTEDVLTLAHELGHGIHSYLSRKQPFLEFHPSTATAEIASIFSEELVFQKMYENIANQKQKTDFLATKIQSIFASIFRQTAFYLFESDIHQHRREKGELTTEEFNHYYQTRLQTMFGDGLKLTKGHQYWWMPILHFYHFNFYVFTYSMGNLITLCLLQEYKKNKKTFLKNYPQALSLGGSKTPKKIIETMKLNINQQKFWQKGLDYLKNLVDEFEKIA